MAIVGLAVCGALAVLAVLPWTLGGATRRAAIEAEISRGFGLEARIEGPVTLKLLPRPRLQLAGLSVGAGRGTVGVSAPALTGDLDLTALARGQWRIVAATLSAPTAAIDLDAWGQRAAGAREPSDPFRLAVKSGVLRVVSRRLGIDTLLTEVTAVALRGHGAKTRLSLSGSAVWRGVPGHFTAQIGEPGGDGNDSAAASLNITSPAGSFSAVGDVSGEAQPQFTGRISASTAAPARIFSVLGLGPYWMNLQRLALSGDAIARPGDLSLSDAALRLNSTRFEGTLGYHSDNGPGLLEGTLATERLDLGGLAGRDIDRASLTDFYRTRLGPHLADTNVDLRISAGALVAGDAEIEDVALSLLARDRRLEATLDEAQAFGGIVKAHVVGSFDASDIKTRAELSLSGLELGPLGIALTGQERMTGILSGKVAVDGTGQSLSDIVASLAGRGQVSVEDGHFMGVSVSQALKRFTRRLPLGTARGQMTAFAAASSGMEIVNGTVNFIDGKVAGPGMTLAFAGQSDLPRGHVDIVALASPTDAAGSPIAGVPGLPLEMRGTWGEPLMVMERSRHLPLPKLLLPEILPEPIMP